MRRIALRTVISTISGIAWSVAAASLLTSFDPLWGFYQTTQAFFVRAGSAGKTRCWLCGMSHSFRYIWRGDIHNAVAFNRHSLALFVFMLPCSLRL